MEQKQEKSKKAVICFECGKKFSAFNVNVASSVGLNEDMGICHNCSIKNRGWKCNLCNEEMEVRNYSFKQICKKCNGKLEFIPNPIIKFQEKNRQILTKPSSQLVKIILLGLIILIIFFHIWSNYFRNKFVSGKSAFEMGSYETAIERLNDVKKSDENFNEAQKLLLEALRLKEVQDKNRIIEANNYKEMEEKNRIIDKTIEKLKQMMDFKVKELKKVGTFDWKRVNYKNGVLIGWEGGYDDMKSHPIWYIQGNEIYWVNGTARGFSSNYSEINDSNIGAQEGMKVMGYAE